MGGFDADSKTLRYIEWQPMHCVSEDGFASCSDGGKQLAVGTARNVKPAVVLQM